MSAAFTQHKRADGIITLTLARPEIRNAFDDALIADLTNALENLSHEASCRALVLTGEGKAFSAGADLNWMQRMATYSEAENLEDSRKLGRLMHVLYGLPFPTIAKVNGPALGGGVGLIACCDIAIASSTAFFALSEAKLGLVPAVISPFVINAIGARQAHRYFQTAERFDAATALRIGLLHEICDPVDLDTRTDAILQELLSSGPHAVEGSKALIRSVQGQPINQALLEQTAQIIAKIRVSSEGQEGLAAFLAKRKPDWAPKQD